MPFSRNRSTRDGGLPPVRIGCRTVTLLRSFGIPTAIAVPLLCLGIAGGWAQVRLGDSPLLWAETHAGNAVLGTFIVRQLVMMARAPRVILTNDALVLRYGWRRVELPWENIVWTGVLPPTGGFGRAFGTRCPADILILIRSAKGLPRLPRQGARRALWWDEDWEGLRFRLTYLAVTPEQFSRHMRNFAGSRWHGARNLPAEANADGTGRSLVVPGYLCLPLLNTVKIVAVVAPMVVLGFFFRLDTPMINAPIADIVLGGAATGSSTLIITWAAWIRISALMVSKCWLEVTSDTIELSTDDCSERLKWSMLSKLEISVAGPASRHWTTPLVLIAHLKSSTDLNLTRTKKWDCFTTRSMGSLQVVPVLGCVARGWPHGLEVFPWQLAEALQMFKQPVPIPAPSQIHPVEASWRDSNEGHANHAALSRS